MNHLQIQFYGDPCRDCGYAWSQSADALIAELLRLPATYRATLAGLEGTAAHPELGWCAAAYVLHVADNLRIHAERMAATARGGPFVFEQYDADALAEVRDYAGVPLEGALWSLECIVGPYVEAFREASTSAVVLAHSARGDQSALEVLRGNAHDAHHHGWDLGRIAGANRA